jgi:hypothetical protein
MCETSRSRVSSVSCPSQLASNSPSPGQAFRLVSAMCSAQRASSSRLRARTACACARPRDTPSAMASSSSYRSCLKLSSMTSRSQGFRPARMDRIRVRSSASHRSPSTWARPLAGWVTTRNCVAMAASGASQTPSDASRVASDSWPTASVSSSQAADVDPIRRRHSFRASANSHGRSLEGSDRSPSVEAAVTNVFCKAPAESAESCSIQWQ